MRLRVHGNEPKRRAGFPTRQLAEAVSSPVTLHHPSCFFAEDSTYKKLRSWRTQQKRALLVPFFVQLLIADKRIS
jgi:hypothetical protein